MILAHFGLEKNIKLYLVKQKHVRVESSDIDNITMKVGSQVQQAQLYVPE